MTVVHAHPHPLAQKIITPANEAIASKFGKVRVEDWDDRVAGRTWLEQNLSGGTPATSTYAVTKHDVPVSDALSVLAVVRCHSTHTGEVVLLHDDWLLKASEQG
jgi:hypothetical protein